MELIHWAALHLGKQERLDENAQTLRDRKRQKADAESLALDAAIEAGMKKVRSKPARSDAYAAVLRPYVLEARGLPKTARKPSVRAIRNRIPTRRKGPAY
jgi:hypothetical protein